MTPQRQPIPGREAEMTQNDAGGYTFTLPALEQMRRFLVLGSEGGSYYASQADLTMRNVQAVRRALDEHGVDAVDDILAISLGGRAPKNDPALLALAMAFAHSDSKVRNAAYRALPDVARTGTHLFTFMDFVTAMRGRGVGLRTALTHWYVGKTPDELAYQLVKYRQRGGWTHRDVLRIAKPRPARGGQRDALLRWAVGKGLLTRENAYGRPGGATFMPTVHIEAFMRAQAAKTPQETAKLIHQYGNALPREALLTEHLSSPEVWMALLSHGMPMTALIRNLPTMTRHGVIAPMSDGLKIVLDQLGNSERLVKARVHPVQVLAALVTYKSGRSLRGSSTWTPVAPVIDALDEAFYAAFGSVEPTGKRMVIALDVSASMDQHPVNGIPGLDARIGSSAMALVTARTEANHVIIGFTDGKPSRARGYGFVHGHPTVPLAISGRQRLDDVAAYTASLAMGGTDVAQPMLWAMREKVEADVFVTYTDNETWAGDIAPSQALQQYRDRMGIAARNVIVGMSATQASNVDPSDPFSLDVVGFDTAAPQVIASFARGEF